MKTPTPKFYGLSNNGTIDFETWKQFSRYLLSMNGKRVEVVVKPYRRQRTIPQNNYWHGVVTVILGEHFGYTGEEMHEALKFEFLRKEESGKPPTVRSTTDLNTVEFNQLIETVQIWAASEYGVFIPDPEKVDA